MSRAVDRASGVLYVVTDLHGEWTPYTRCRDHFLALHGEGLADCFLLLGDVIHGYGPASSDQSVEILLDVMRLQDEMGDDVVTLLLGNHEFAHLYYTPLVKGEVSFTPRFERAVGEHREAIREFLLGLPFMVRTAGGALLTHAGASSTTATPAAAGRLLTFSHEAFFQEIDRRLEQIGLDDLLRGFGFAGEIEYRKIAMRFLAVEGPQDPRYRDLMRGFVAGSIKPDWPLLWEFFFTQCERKSGSGFYRRVLNRFLEVYSPPDVPQRVLVTGHIVVEGGHAIVAGKQLRLASWAHARPHDAGQILLYPADRPVERAADLIRYLHPLP